MSKFSRYINWVLAYPRRAWGWTALLMLVSILSASQLKINTNILELLPPDEPTTLAVKRLQKEDGKIGVLTIGLKGASEDVIPVLQELANQFEQSSMVDFAFFDLPEEWQQRLGMLQIEVSDLRDLETRLQGGLNLGPSATNPLIASQLFALGPISDKLQSADEGFVLSQDGIFRLLVRPKGSPYDPKFSRAFWDFAQDVVANVELENSNVDLVWIGGAYRHAVEDRDVIIKDISSTTGVALGFVLLIIGLAYRDIRALPILFFPMIIGAGLTWGFTGLVIGEVNTFTSTFTAIIVGLGIDFSIHLYSRYREEFSAIQDQKEAIVRAFECAGPPCITAAITSAGGFLALRFAGFVGFQQLGLVLAAGVLFCLGAVITILPLMILWLDNQKTDASLLRPPFGPNVEVKYRRAKWWLTAMALIGALSWIVIPKLSFEYDLSALRPNGLAYNELSVAERAVVRKSFQPIVVSTQTEEELLVIHNHLKSLIEENRTDYFHQFFSIYSVIPPDQDERLTILRRLKKMNEHPNIVYLPTTVQRNLQTLNNISMDPITKSDLPRQVRGLLGESEESHRLFILPNGNMWDIRENNELAREVDSLLVKETNSSIEVAGEYLALASLYRLISKDGLTISAIALVLVFLFSWMDMRSIKRASSAVIILLMGMSWAGAGLYFANVKLSLVNFVGIPIVMGIGIDVIIHLIHRISEEGPGRIRFALRTTGFAAIVSATTTILSFSSLLFATNRGLHSMGKMIVVGLTLVTFVALVSIPLGWMSTWFTRKQAPPEL